jgi:hypothetical protein
MVPLVKVPGTTKRASGLPLINIENRAVEIQVDMQFLHLEPKAGRPMR